MDSLLSASVISVPVMAYYWHEFGLTFALVTGVGLFGAIVFGERFKAEGNDHGVH